MPYATNGAIAREPMDGYIEISEEQYAQALAGMLEGLRVSVEAGFQLIRDEPQVDDLEPDPEPSIPPAVSRRQGRLALLEIGKLDQVEDSIGQIPDPVERRAAQIEYEADTWERGSPFLVELWLALGGTESDLDALFQLASTK